MYQPIRVGHALLLLPSPGRVRATQLEVTWSWPASVSAANAVAAVVVEQYQGGGRLEDVDFEIGPPQGQVDQQDDQDYGEGGQEKAPADEAWKAGEKALRC